MMPIRVVCVEDSAVMRVFLRDALSSTDEIEVVGAAHDPLIARDMIKRLQPDVLTLDINMPNMDGLDFLERLMRLKPLPVIMFSAYTQEGSNAALQALAAGAVDFVAKPAASEPDAWNDAARNLIAKIKSAASAQIQAALPAPSDGRRRSAPIPASGWPRSRIVAIGASTGGVQALRQVLGSLPANAPPILVAQHMPPNFTSSFAKRLNATCDVAVAEAEDGVELMPGSVYVAPGDRHLLLDKGRGGFVCRLEGGAEINGHMPSIDLLFSSVASVAGSAAMGIVLTGMGRDGAQGLSDIRQAGGVTAAQDQATSLIYGMPKAAIEAGAAQFELSIDRVASFILEPQSRSRKPATLEGQLSHESR
ncbi:MAG: protein-glutamate methylesterase/protein-glutamine glutaminase [Hyphomicrobium sp.]